MSLFDMRWVITSLSGSDAILRRRGTDVFDNYGRLTSTPYTDSSTIRVSIQPTEGKDLMRLPEALRSMEVSTIYCTEYLENADRIIVDEIQYQVEGSASWDPNSKYYKLLVRKLGDSES